MNSSRPADAPAPGAVRRWLHALRPAPHYVDAREFMRVVVGAGLGIGLTGWLCHALALPSPLGWIIAPMGASAVLVFGVPASPLAQPWAVVGGNTVSALVAVLCVHWLGAPLGAAPVAVGLAIALMFALRCLHPPGGATALLVALAGVTDPRVALVPVLLNSALLAAVGMLWNTATGRRYPHAQTALATPLQPATEADLDAVLARYNQVLDVSRDDLQALVAQTQLLAHERRLTQVRCGDIMSRELTTVAFGTPLQEAWTLLLQRRIKALPVVDRARRVVGIVTLADFLKSVDLAVHEGFAGRLRGFLRGSGTSHSDKPEVVGQIMTRTVRVTSEQRHLADLIPLFGSTGHHHIPVLGEAGRLVGMITQSDVVAALAARDAA